MNTDPRIDRALAELRRVMAFKQMSLSDEIRGIDRQIEQIRAPKW